MKAQEIIELEEKIEASKQMISELPEGDPAIRLYESWAKQDAEKLATLKA